MNEQQSVANRYFGVFKNGKIKGRGITARRKDTPAYIADVQMELSGLLASVEYPKDGLAIAAHPLHIHLVELHAGRVKLERLIVAQPLTRDLEEYHSPSSAARAAAQLLQAGKVVKPGQRVKFLYILGDLGVRAWDLPGRVDPRTINIGRYEDLLIRATEEVLSPFDKKRPFLDLMEGRTQTSLLCREMIARYRRQLPTLGD